MRWRKLGRVFAPDGTHPLLRTHASNPVAEPLGGDFFRVYFGSRDDAGRTHIAAVVAELTDSACTLVEPPADPLLAPGPRGGFDDSGVSVGCVVTDGPRTLLYYLGWNLGVTVPWRNSIGLAVRTGTGPFEKASPAPLLDRSAEDPFTLSYPCVLREGDRWRMWYGSHRGWGDGHDDMDHVVKHATSADGLSWQRDGRTVLTAPAIEMALARPWVLNDGGRYRMWVSHRGTSYRLGYAESGDGIGWVWRGPAGLEPSPDGWDSEMVCYPSVFRHRGRLALFYNGNRYGRTGFGVAVEDA